MKYNTELKRMPLPEYGRNIQNMVDHCITIEDDSERMRCAKTIIDIMGNMFPHLRDVNDFKHILWDHLAIMADFKLDIAFPFRCIKKEELCTRPKAIPYAYRNIRFRHYGTLIGSLIDSVKDLEDSEMKQRLVLLIAKQMKKSFLTWNKETVEDQKILMDLEMLSEGTLRADEVNSWIGEGNDLLKNTYSNGGNAFSVNARKKQNRKFR